MKEQPKSRELMPIHSADSKYGISPIPFEWLSESNAKTIHDQTLTRLAQRGGLGIREILFNMDAISKEELFQNIGKQETYVKYLKFILAYRQRGEQIEELKISRVSGEPLKPDLWAQVYEDAPHDGPYLCFIEEPQECLSVWKYCEVIQNRKNTWVLKPNQKVTHWMLLPKSPQ